ncbi:MarR family winged helix-turn-helix transcriptional regulator [Polaromonas sp. C04]|uniref:MarR family winged helix-turn-helix transcriptional regulator n=1 Tax=Polaromonas sp. C04 TaxID=1945857 RepID=UPI000986542F|nr:MarR family winged helix-turn-helix transcriptional regulator [Polaromonas sp. C04]OOG52212.1 MarR family transcriptional regulator [Polaromonas sp. C04]
MNAVLDPSPQAALKTLGCTNLRLRQLMRHVGQHYDLEMAKVGLRTTQYSLLSHVLKLGPVRPTELAKAMQLGASTLTRNLKPLVDAGWVELSAGSDARSRSVTITAQGRAKRAEAQHHWRAAQQSLNRLLGTQRVLALHGLIDESIDLLSSVDSGDAQA